jgi:phosphoribosyl-AMP cyclohydrolase
MSVDVKALNIKLDENGLLCAIIQDAHTGDVLMQAYMNEEALEKTFSTGKCHFYSRSRKKLWLKGEESGHTQELKSIALDCDRDVVLIKVEQKGGACHKGYQSCFFTEVDVQSGETRITAKPVFDPDKIYRK